MCGRPGKSEVRWLSTAEALMKTIALFGFLPKTGHRTHVLTSNLSNMPSSRIRSSVIGW
jgi:hypothetical protein